MTYVSILVNVDVDAPVAPIAKLAVDLGRRFNARRLLGFCAADAAIPLVITPETGALLADAWQQLRNDLFHQFARLREEFDDAVGGSIAADWIQALDHPTRSLGEAAHMADLIVMRSPQDAATDNLFRSADPGAVVLQAGRPVLITPNTCERISAKKVVIAWKNTREARRAVSDAVPMLRLAHEVALVVIDAEPDNEIRHTAQNVASFLLHHGVRVATEVLTSRDETDALLRFLASFEADLVVSGAYGHSRVREWAFGGMTRSLLDQTGISRLMAS
ncbi:MAG: universal stress protein [Rhizobiales bacterium]|nr:universal stress protein [Hyphomicrobiales bacterium]